MSAMITGKNYLVTKVDRYNKYQTKQYTHALTFTLHTQHLVANTWLGDHQGRPSASLTRCVKPSKYGALTNTLDLELTFFNLDQWLSGCHTCTLPIIGVG